MHPTPKGPDDRGDQVQLGAAARTALADGFGLLSSADVAHAAGSRAQSRSAMAYRWRAQARVFTVEVGGEALFPGFQFDAHSHPRPVIARVLEVFGDRLTGWALALWFTGSNDWLGALRPVDVLDSAAEQVVDAARRLSVELLG